MSRPIVAGLALLAWSAPAAAWEDRQPLTATGTQREGIEVVVPLGLAIPVPSLVVGAAGALGITVPSSIWVGVSVVLEGYADITVDLDATTTLSWGDLGVGTFGSAIAPELTTVALDWLGAARIEVSARDGSASGAPVFPALTLIGDELTASDVLGTESGALLPGDTPDVLIAEQKAFEFAGIAFGVGATSSFRVELVDGLAGKLRAEAEARGVSLQRKVQGTVVQDTPIQPATPVGGLDAEIGYTNDVALDLAWEWTADPAIKVTIAGLSLGSFPVAGLKDTEITLIDGVITVIAVGSTRHPLPLLGDVQPSRPTADVGTTVDVLVGVVNEGEAALSLTPQETSGDPAFAFPAGEFVVAPPGADWRVPFTPTAAGERTATVTLATSDPWQPSATWTVAGTATGGPSGDGLTPDDLTAGGSAQYDTCGCASAPGRGGLGWGLALGTALIGLGRRRSTRAG